MKKKKEETISVVEREAIYQGIDPQGFGEFDDYSIVKVRTKFKVGTKVKVTIEEVK